jgi:hypothetical protein
MVAELGKLILKNKAEGIEGRCDPIMKFGNYFYVQDMISDYDPSGGP